MFKALKYSLVLMATVLLVSSCSKDDDEPSCTQADWLGTYTATSNCDPDRVEALDIVITAGPTENELIFTDSDGDATTYTISGCQFPEFGIFTITLSGELNGNTITWNVADNDPDDMYSCTITYEKQ